jgi:hypothetical protein
LIGLLGIRAPDIVRACQQNRRKRGGKEGEMDRWAGHIADVVTTVVGDGRDGGGLRGRDRGLRPVGAQGIQGFKGLLLARSDRRAEVDVVGKGSERGWKGSGDCGW